MTPSIGIFGKIPTTGDFIAMGASSPVAQAFQVWLQAENDQLAARQRPLPPTPIRFVFRDPGHTGVLIGLMVPSQDSVGRQFPLAIVSHLDPAFAAERLPSLPAAYAPFLDRGATLLASAPNLDPRSFEHHARGLPAPGATELHDAHVWVHEALNATPGLAILEALFGSVQTGVHYFGIHMFRSACERVRGHDPGTASIYLECPCVDDVQLAFWLVFAQRQLGWSMAPPSFLWTDPQSADHRLILGLGAPSPGTLEFVAAPGLAAERLWPTRTSSQQGVEHGRAGLSERQRAVLEPPAPSASLLLAGLDPVAGAGR